MVCFHVTDIEIDYQVLLADNPFEQSTVFALYLKSELCVHKRSIPAKTQAGIGRLSKDLFLLRAENFCKRDVKGNKGIAKSFQNLVVI